MFKIAALYKFCTIENPIELKNELELLALANNITGGLIIASEGINGTIAGIEESLNTFLNRFLNDNKFDNLEIKYSYNQIEPFVRMRISVKKEIVTMGIPSLNIEENDRGVYVNSEEWNKLLLNKDTLVIDTRNDYEVDIGTFQNAINPSTKSFKDFPQYVEDNLIEKKDKPIAMFCTGGIRCEKASAFLLSKGFKNVYNLKGGILQYLEETNVNNSLWEGECFVFDQRITVDQNLQTTGNYQLCKACRTPLKSEDINNNPHYVFGISCPKCYESLTNDKINKLNERNLQIKLAEERNVKHLGYKHPGHIFKKSKNND